MATSPQERSFVHVLGVAVDRVTLTEARDRVCSWLKELQGASAKAEALPGRYVVTPNLDHAVQLRSNAALRDAYAAASLITADGSPLILASRLSGLGLAERVAGSDLTPAVLSSAPPGCRVFLLGGSETTSSRAAARISESYPHLVVCGRSSPPIGFHLDDTENDRILQQIRTSGAQLILIGLGAPKQELWVAQHQEQLAGTVSLCVGATLDFIAGTVQRAPLWAQRFGVEWVHRLLSDPRRLATRYAKDAVYFPYLLARDLLASD